ncbi:MAG: hypothetical protein JWQ33_755 [Ramlibacter sp.]|nr:hypothetical protein [Ramlibacter sp.]
MEERQARLTILIDPQNKEAFEAICSSQEETSSEVVRQLILDYLARHGVSYRPETEKKRRSRR